MEHGLGLAAIAVALAEREGGGKEGRKEGDVFRRQLHDNYSARSCEADYGVISRAGDSHEPPTISYWYALLHFWTSASSAPAGGSRMFQSLISNGCVWRIFWSSTLATWRQR